MVQGKEILGDLLLLMTSHIGIFSLYLTSIRLDQKGFGWNSTVTFMATRGRKGVDQKDALVFFVLCSNIYYHGYGLEFMDNKIKRLSILLWALLNLSPMAMSLQ